MGHKVFCESFVHWREIFSFQLKILTINKRCFGVWPKHGYFNFFKEDYYV